MTKPIYLKLETDISISKIRVQRPYGKEWNEHKIKSGQKVIIGFKSKRFFGVVLSTDIKMNPYDHLKRFSDIYPDEIAFEMIIDVKKQFQQ